MLSELIKRYKKRCEERHEKQVKEHAEDLYQIREYKGQVWLTFNGYLICPCTFLEIDYVHALEDIRGMYVERELSK